MKLLKLTYNGPNNVIFALPTSRMTTFTIRQENTRRKIGSLSGVESQRTTFESDTPRNLVQPGCADACASLNTERLAVRTVFSGSVSSAEELKKAVADHFYNVNLAMEDAILGFINRTAAYAVETNVA